MKDKECSKITILIDMDDTIENLLDTWCDWLNSEYNLHVSPDDITEWNMAKFYPTLSKEQVHEPLYNPKLWDKVKPIDGAVEYVKKLIDDGYNIYLCTSTDYRNVEIKYEKIVQKYFPYIKWNQVIITNKKQMIDADFLIDDCVHNLEGGKYKGILMTAPHNIHYDCKANGMYRVNNWKDIYKLIRNIGERK